MLVLPPVDILEMSSRFLKQNLFRHPDDKNSRDTYEYQSLLGDESDDENQSKGVKFALQSKNPSQYIQYAVQPGDTLQSIALRFNCPVAQIKQANSILRENEIFALRTVRVPVAPFSVLRDGLAAVHTTHGASKTSESQRTNIVETTSTAILVSLDELTPNHDNNREVHEGNLSDEGLHNPLLVPFPAPFQPKIELETDAPKIDILQHQTEDKHASLFHCSGVDGGLSWLALVFCSLILGFAGPLIYIFFLYEHQQERRNHTHT